MGIFDPDGKLAVFLNTLGRLIVLNLLTLFCSLPVVTAGAAWTSMYACVLRMIRGEEGHVLRDYFRDFKQNFRQCTCIWIPSLLILLFMAFDIYILQSIEGTPGQAYRILIFVLILLILMLLIFMAMLMARFENTWKGTLKNAVVLSLGKPLPALLMLFVTLSPLLLYYASLRFLSVGFLLGFSGPAYLTGIYFNKIFKRFENQ